MIKEIIAYTKNLKENSPKIFEFNQKPSVGIHLFVSFDEQGKLKTTDLEQGRDYDFYDGKGGLSSCLEKAMTYEACGEVVRRDVNKVLDKKKKIISCSPFIVSFRKKVLTDEKLEGEGSNKILPLLSGYFLKAFELCGIGDEYQQKALLLKAEMPAVFSLLKTFENEEGEAYIDSMKEEFYINIYLADVALNHYEEAHSNYLAEKLFNSDNYNQEVDEEVYGVSGFYNGLNSKKDFLKHKTAPFYKGVNSRITIEEATYLNTFELACRQKIFPNPLPIFIDKEELDKGESIIQLYHKDTKLSYSQLLKTLFEKNTQTLQNYYLLFRGNKGEIEDFDFVPQFRYQVDDCQVLNLFKIVRNQEELPTRSVRTIYGVESYVIQKIFNNALVTVNSKKETYNVHYFGDLPDSKYYRDATIQLVGKYRKAIYDYLYKSNQTAFTAKMFDDIMECSILDDIRTDTFEAGKGYHTNEFLSLNGVDNPIHTVEKGYHTNGFKIKEKLNIWFSLYQYFELSETHKRKNMKNLTVELPKVIYQNALDNNQCIHTDDEFAFATGQVIWFLLRQSKGSNRTHALLEPFLQKHNIKELQKAIIQTLAMYKHEVKFYSKKYVFDKVISEVLGYESDNKIQDMYTLILAGYFAESMFYKKDTEEQEKDK